MSKVRYYKPNIPLSLKDEIIRLFEENVSIKNQFDNNIAEFIRSAVRREIQRLRQSEIINDDFRKILIDEIFDRISSSK